MLIKSLSLKNFQCYCGEFDQNRFDFKSGLNLIIGNNGNGKSKVFDGFYWVLYDQIFDTDMRQFTSTAIYGEKLISDKVTRNCEVSNTVSAEACLVVESAQGKEYRLTRVFHCTKLAEKKWMKEPSILLIEEKKTNRWTTSAESAESVLNRVIPTHIKPYMWFQGEQVDSLMDLTKKNSLAQIINLLSDINFYDELVDIADKGLVKSSKNLLKAQKSISKNVSQSEKLEAEFNSNLDTIGEIEDDRVIINENLTDAKAKIDELINKIENATSKSQLKAEKELLTGRLAKSEIELVAKQKGFTSKIFNDYWILKYCKPSLLKFGKKYKDYFTLHQKIINQQEQTTYKLPLNVPQPLHLQGMLEDKKCYVCDSDFEEGSDAYTHIEQLVTRNNSLPTDIFDCDCSDYYQHLYDKSIRYHHLIEGTNERISEAFDDVTNLQTEILGFRTRLDDINSEFEGLIENDDSDSIVSTYKRAQNNVEKFSAQLAAKDNLLKSKKERQEKIKRELDNLTVGSVDSALENASKIFTSLVEITKSTRKDVYDNIILELQVKSNKIFESMTASNTSFTGKIKLKRLENGACIPEIVDRDGYTMTGSNDSNIILVKLSLIMAILTARAKWSDNYTLISDAPTSKMAQEYSIGFYKALSNNFTQSIVMTYDFIEREDRVKFIMENRQHIGTVHLLKSQYANGNRDDRSDLETIIEEVS
jgi:DNA sulfur modification protein DndD|tara:strand:- start:2044 stop:4155 length:2112 start_codon:yes stop_codon:yes gene_type:complete